MTETNTLSNIDYLEYMFAIVTAYLPSEEGHDLRRVAGDVVFRHADKDRNSYKNGVVHSYSDQPALIIENYKPWCFNGMPHRDYDRPAVIYRDKQEWWKKVKRNREGESPAIHTKLWWKNRLIHRHCDKSAIITSFFQSLYKDGAIYRDEDMYQKLKLKIKIDFYI
jgi:hypothetical protein